MQTQEEDAAMRLGPDDKTYSLQKPHFRNGMNFRSGAARSQGRRPHSQATCQKMLPKPPSHKKLQPQATPPKELTSDTEKSTYIYIYIYIYSSMCVWIIDKMCAAIWFCAEAGNPHRSISRAGQRDSALQGKSND